MYEENDLLFPSETGTYIDSRNLLRSWQKVFEGLDIPYKRFHSLRHTFATKLIKNGSQLITVSRLLGHSSVKTTEIYAHHLESIERQMANVFDNIIEENKEENIINNQNGSRSGSGKGNLRIVK